MAQLHSCPSHHILADGPQTSGSDWVVSGPRRALRPFAVIFAGGMDILVIFRYRELDPVKLFYVRRKIDIVSCCIFLNAVIETVTRRITQGRKKMG